MLSRAGTMRESAATEVCFEPVCLLLVGHISEHPRRRVAVIAGDNQAASCGHAINHLPERLRGKLLRGFTTELLETVARLRKLMDTVVRPMVPKHNSRRGGNPVKTVIPRSIQTLSACARKMVRQARSVIVK